MNPARSDRTPSSLPSRAELRSRIRRSWYLGAGTLLLSQIGLTVIEVTRLDPGETFWPWAKTDLALLFALTTANLLLLGYLTLEQRRTLALHAVRRRWDAEKAEILGHHQTVLRALSEVTQAASGEGDPQNVFDRISAACHRTFPSDQVSLMLLDRERTHLVVRSALGHPDGVDPVGDRWKVGDGVAGWVAKQGRSIRFGPGMPLKGIKGLRPRAYPTTAAMVVPVVLRDEIIGVLSVSSRTPAVSYTEDDLEALLVFADAVAVYCRSAEQREWMQQAILAVNESVTKKPANSSLPPAA